jgi:hypothetical protein
LYEEFLSRYPKCNHVAEARERIKDIRSKQVAAVSPTAAVSPSDNNKNMAREDASPVPKSPDRSLFTSEDSQRIAAVGAKLNLKMPTFNIPATQGDLSSSNSRLVGAWSSERSWGNGKGRQGMLIITEVSATGMARGYYLWGRRRSCPGPRRQRATRSSLSISRTALSHSNPAKRSARNSTKTTL